MYEFLINKRLKNRIPENLLRDGKYSLPEMKQFFGHFFHSGMSLTAEARTPPYLQAISRLFMEGKRDIYIWDEMTKVPEMDFVASNCPLARPLIDMGCGYGYWLGKTINEVDLGIDIFDAENTSQSRAISGFEDRNFIDDTYLSVLRADCSSELPLPDSCVSTVLSISHLVFSRNPEGAFSEIRRILKPGGNLLLSLSTPEKFETYRLLYSKEYYDGIMESTPVHSVKTSDEWEALMRENGFHIQIRKGYLSFYRNLIHALTSYPHAFGDVTWNQKAFGTYVRKHPELYQEWIADFLPWLTEECPPEKATLICYKCTLEK